MEKPHAAARISCFVAKVMASQSGNKNYCRLGSHFPHPTRKPTPKLTRTFLGAAHTYAGYELSTPTPTPPHSHAHSLKLTRTHTLTHTLTHTHTHKPEHTPTFTCLGDALGMSSAHRPAAQHKPKLTLTPKHTHAQTHTLTPGCCSGHELRTQACRPAHGHYLRVFEWAIIRTGFDEEVARQQTTTAWTRVRMEHISPAHGGVGGH
jgi:hypothetical protein